jgi:hypothetical protein
MVEVIALKPGDALPDGEVAVLVGPTEDESGMTTDRSWTYFSYLPNVPGARESRIAEAQLYAEEQGIRRVYVLEAGLEAQAAETDPSAAMPLKVEAETG